MLELLDSVLSFDPLVYVGTISALVVFGAIQSVVSVRHAKARKDAVALLKDIAAEASNVMTFAGAEVAKARRAAQQTSEEAMKALADVDDQLDDAVERAELAEATLAVFLARILSDLIREGGVTRRPNSDGVKAAAAAAPPRETEPPTVTINEAAHGDDIHAIGQELEASEDTLKARSHQHPRPFVNWNGGHPSHSPRAG